MMDIRFQKSADLLIGLDLSKVGPNMTEWERSLMVPNINVHVDAFWYQYCPVTCEQYSNFLSNCNEQSEDLLPSEWDSYSFGLNPSLKDTPVANVSKKAAEKYCFTMKGRLPREEELSFLFNLWWTGLTPASKASLAIRLEQFKVFFSQYFELEKEHWVKYFQAVTGWCDGLDGEDQDVKMFMLNCVPEWVENNFNEDIEARLGKNIPQQKYEGTNQEAYYIGGSFFSLEESIFRRSPASSYDKAAGFRCIWNSNPFDDFH